MSNRMQSIWLSGVASGVLITVLANIPVVGACLCCLAYMGAGVMTVWHYANTYERTLAGGTGAGMGAIAGLIASLVSSVLGFIASKLGITPSMEEVFQELEDSGQMPPDQLDMFLGLMENPLFYVGMILLGMVIGAVLGTLGGAIGASLFKKGGELPNE